MLVGCSSNLLSQQTHRFRSEAVEQFEPCHLPSMSTKRLDLPCSFAQKDAPKAQVIRPASLSVEKKPFEAKTNSGWIKHEISLPHSAKAEQTTFVEGRREREVEFWGKDKSKKRFAEQVPYGDANGAKRRRGNEEADDLQEEESKMIFGQLKSRNIWMPHGSLVTGLDPPQLPFYVPFSGVDEMSVVSGDVIPPPLPFLNNNPWVERSVKEVTEFSEKNVETIRNPVDVSRSSSSSESHEFSPSLKEKPYDGNGSRPRKELGEVVIRPSEYVKHREDEGFELISLLVACAEAIVSKNIPGINQIIARLGVLASPTGSPISRVTAYFTEALALRAVRLWPQIFYISPPRQLDRVDDNCGTALRLLNQVTPIPRLIHFTANEILFRVFEGKEKVHIIDFDIKQGLQWPGLFQSFASRAIPPSHIRVTGVGKSKHELIETGLRLSGFAEALNLPFEFHPVVDRLEDVRLWMLHVKENESVVVNCMFQLHKMLYDNTGVLRNFFELIRSTHPTIVIMAEQEAEHNEGSLETRLANSLRYYSAIFDSLEASVPPPLDSSIRRKIEEMYADEIKNIIASEESDRFERHQGFGKWRKMMEQQGGFCCLDISERELLHSQMILKMYEGENFNVVKQENGGITLRWLDQPLYTVSAWEVLDVADSSSSFSSSPFAKAD